jgi:hypothetical protein
LLAHTFFLPFPGKITPSFTCLSDLVSPSPEEQAPSEFGNYTKNFLQQKMIGKSYKRCRWKGGRIEPSGNNKSVYKEKASIFNNRRLLFYSSVCHRTNSVAGTLSVFHQLFSQSYINSIAFVVS